MNETSASLTLPWYCTMQKEVAALFLPLTLMLYCNWSLNWRDMDLNDGPFVGFGIGWMDMLVLNGTTFQPEAGDGAP